MRSAMTCPLAPTGGVPAMPADPRFSAGARLERKAILAHVRRLIRMPQDLVVTDLVMLESWLLKRQARYNQKPGGLGK